MRLISEAVACRLKTVIFIISNVNLVAYANNKFISEGNRPLLSDVLEITNSLDI